MRLNLKLLRLNGNQREDIFKKGGGGRSVRASSENLMRHTEKDISKLLR